jgi:hypothetical protein
MTMRYVGGLLARTCALFIFSALALGCQKARYSGELPTPTREAASIISDSQYPGVILVVSPGNTGICTGTFVSERAVLTASHCVTENGTYTVVTSFGTFRTATKKLFGPGIVDDPNDIALLIFDRAVASREQGQVYAIDDSVATGDVIRLVGYGCNNIDTRRGSGVKRTGTNVVASLDEYIEFLTPLDSGSSSSRGIFGSSNRAASCFGDSGGPAAVEKENGELVIVGVTHAGGQEGSNQISQYVNVATRSDNRSFLRDAASEYGIEIRGL